NGSAEDVARLRMIKPISLRLRHTQALTQARATLIRAGRGEELKQAHNAAVMEQARRNVANAQEQARLKRVATLQANKAVFAIKQAYDAQIKAADEFDRERWIGLRDFVVNELERIIEGRRP